jgi:hypothetical protein
MKRKMVLIASLAVAAVPAPALAEANYYVRNETSLGLSCGLRRERSSVLDRFALPAGGEWSQTLAGDGPRIMMCGGGRVPPRFQLRPGVRYSLVQLRSGALALVSRR